MIIEYKILDIMNHILILTAYCLDRLYPQVRLRNNQFPCQDYIVVVFVFVTRKKWFPHPLPLLISESSFALAPTLPISSMRVNW